MADAGLIDKLNADNNQADTSMVLDTLMYCDALTDGEYEDQTVSYIVNDLLESGQLEGEELQAVLEVQKYINTPQGSGIGELLLGTSSIIDDYEDDFKGAFGATFYSDKGGEKTVYVAFKGTGDGRWFDNGDAFAKKFSPYQQKAAEFYDYAIERLMDEHGVDESWNIISTGHSKGGNSAQFIALASKHADFIDRVIAIDGQSMSPEGQEYMKELYGEKFFKEQCGKMFLIAGDNDYVHGLAPTIIPEDQTVYIKTATSDNDFYGAHAAYKAHDDKTDPGGTTLFDFNGGGFLETTTEERPLAQVSRELNDFVFSLPVEERGAVCRSIMSVLEATLPGERKVGLNGEKSDASDYLVLLKNSDEIVETLLNDGDVKAMIDEALVDLIKNKGINNDNEKISAIVSFIVEVAYDGDLNKAAEGLENIAKGVTRIVSTGVEIYEKVKKVEEFCSNALNAVKGALKYLSSDYRAALKYLEQSSIIKCDTNALRNLAERIRRLNSRLDNLDYELSCLYSEVKWTDLWTLQRADMKIGYSNRLQKCADYLSNTADRFEAAESEILGLFG